MKTWIVWFAPLIFLTSCTSGQRIDIKELKEIEARIEAKQKEIDRKTQIYVRGAIDLIKTVPESERNSQDILAIRLLADAENLIGTPPTADQLDVTKLITGDVNTISLLEISEKQDDKLIADKKKLEIKKELVEDKVRKQAEEIVSEKHLSFFERIKRTVSEYIALFLTLLLLFLLFPFIYWYVSKLVKSSH